MATIRLRNDRWQVIVKRKGHPQQSKTFDLKKDAEKWGRQQERLMDAGEWVDRSEAHRTTLGELFDRYGKEVSSKKRGAESELIRLNVFKQSDLAKYSAAAVTAKMVAEWRDERLKEVSSGTVLRELQLIGHVFTIAIREWGINLQGNPVALIRKPSPGKSRDRVLTDDERSRLLDELSICRNPWVKPAVVFALETAARRGEILSLTWDCVDLKGRTATISGKTGTRTIPLSPACLDMMRSLPRSLDGTVFPLSREALKQAYERAVVRADIKDFTFHDLRHDALTRLAKLGFSVLELRAISGHTTANMLQRYVSIDARDLAHRLAKVG
ncbi:site-specific integrase [Thauera sp. 63]|uniref:site-specific integrase n=1 Tax=Thauera sp. 63 TaxID=497321 RepID=UPI0002D01FC1|nr:site-specific integrase [Thauera sp. 63]ENO75335.1 phage integrase family site specific recombinase [Thauera sp. 63]